MALRGAQQMAQRLLMQQQVQPAALLDRCAGGAAQLLSAGAHWQGASAALTVLCSRSLHSSAVLRADDSKDDVDAANQGLEELFGTRPASGPQAGTPADAPPSPADAAPDGSSKSSAVAAATAAGGAPFSTVHTAAADGVDSSAQGDEFRVRESEPKPTESPQLAHPTPTTSGRLTHVDKQGRAAMVDVGKKLATQREAVASAKVLLGAEVFHLVATSSMKKGDVLTVAELAGIMGAKHTCFLIPLCHNISLNYVDVKLKLLEEEQAVGIRAEVRTVGPTGVEMEALTAASTAALTIYDMCKAVSRRLVISSVVLESKHGGKSGTYIRSEHGTEP